MAEYLQQGPVYQSMLVFVNELGKSLERKTEERYARTFYSQDRKIEELSRDIDDLNQVIESKDDCIKQMADELQTQQAKESALAIQNSSVSVYTNRQGNKTHLLYHSNPKYGGGLQPGTITHEDVQRQFNNFFSKHRRNYGSKLVTLHDDRKKYSIPCFVLKIAFQYCKNFLLRHLTATMLQQRMDESFQKAVDKLCEYAKRKYPNEVIFMDPRLVAMKELEDVFMIPNGKTVDCWEEKKLAFLILLNCSDVEEKRIEMIAQTKHQIVRSLQHENYDENMIEEGINIAFSMVTLVPPVLICHPPKYNEDWMEPRSNYWSDKGCHTPMPITIYFRPVLFFSSTGGIGTKGEVGNKSFEKGNKLPLSSEHTHHSASSSCINNHPIPNDG